MAIARTEPKLALEWNEEIRAWSGKRRRILARLEQGPATNRALNKICFRYSARIWEIRKAIATLGWGIRCEPIKPGFFRFELVKVVQGKELTSSAA